MNGLVEPARLECLEPVAPLDLGTWSAVVARVSAARSALLVLHVRPDGDSVGSSIALARGLRALGKAVWIASPDPVPENLAFLDPGGECLPPERISAAVDLAIFVDCADLERTGSARPLLRQAETVVNLDHHPSNSRFGHLNYVDPRAAACGEIVYALLLDLQAPVDALAATALYAALATDTGSFRFENTTAHTLALAARLVEWGARPALVGQEIWNSRSLASLRLLQSALGSLGLTADGRIAWMSLTPSMLRRAGASVHDGEGLVDYARSLRGVEIALLFTLERPGLVRVNLRSRSGVDVSDLAALFGGGGHARAAGCTVRGSLRSVRETVLAAARQALDGSLAGGGRGESLP